ncbi:MAG: hypothetical protein GX366_06425 [Epulopiscium sp.]|nr:hypothetical protein [Candidatus Epulonipiscium sp.]
MEDQIFILASHYKQQYYENPKYEGLPIEIRDEMKELCIRLAEKLRGIVTLAFNHEGEVILNIKGEEGDFSFDEIGAQLELKEIREENAEQFQMMKLWYLMYHTDYGQIFRKVTVLYQEEKKDPDEIIDLLIKEYGHDMEKTIIETVEIVKG